MLHKLNCGRLASTGRDSAAHPSSVDRLFEAYLRELAYRLLECSVRYASRDSEHSRNSASPVLSALDQTCRKELIQR